MVIKTLLKGQSYNWFRLKASNVLKVNINYRNNCFTHFDESKMYKYLIMVAMPTWTQKHSVRIVGLRMS